MNNTALTCQELVELVTDYLDNALPEADRRRFEEHLAGCPGCTNYVEQARHTICIAGRLPESSLSPAARDELLRVFSDWKRGKA